MENGLPFSPTSTHKRKILEASSPQKAIELILTLRENLDQEGTLYLFDYDGVIAACKPTNQGGKITPHVDKKGLRLPVCPDLVDLFKTLRNMHPNRVHLLSASTRFSYDALKEEKNKNANLGLNKVSKSENFIPLNWRKKIMEFENGECIVYLHLASTPLMFVPKMGFSTYNPNSHTGNKKDCLGPILKALEERSIKVRNVIFIDDIRGYVEQVVHDTTLPVNIFGIHLSGDHCPPELPEIYQPYIPFS